MRRLDKKCKDNANPVIEKAYSEKYPEGDLTHGKNLLVFEVSKLMLQQFLDQQIRQLVEAKKEGVKLKIIHLEKFFNTALSVNIAGGPLIIKIKGKVDRIDQMGNNIRIIDYKSGNIDGSKLKVSNWEELNINPAYDKAFQLLLYAYILHKNQGTRSFKLESGNISLRAPSKGFLQLELPQNQQLDEQSMNTFEKHLVSLLEMIYAPDTQFYQTEDLEICGYCPFKAICNR